MAKAILRIMALLQKMVPLSKAIPPEYSCILTCLEQIEEHMPMLLYEQVCKSAGGGDLASRF